MKIKNFFIVGLILGIIFSCPALYGYLPQDVYNIFPDDIGGKPFVIASSDFNPLQKEELFSIINSMDVLKEKEHETLTYVGSTSYYLINAKSTPQDKREYYANLAAKCIAKLAIAGDDFAIAMCHCLKRNKADRYLSPVSGMEQQQRLDLVISLLKNTWFRQERGEGLWGEKKR